MKKMRVMTAFSKGQLHFHEGEELWVHVRDKDRGKFVMLDVSPEDAALAGQQTSRGSTSEQINLAEFVRDGRLVEVV